MRSVKILARPDETLLATSFIFGENSTSVDLSQLAQIKINFEPLIMILNVLFSQIHDKVVDSPLFNMIKPFNGPAFEVRIKPRLLPFFPSFREPT